MIELSPLVEGSEFYPPVFRSEEDVEKIVASSPRPLTKILKSTPEEKVKQWENDIKNVFQRVADKTRSTKEKVIKAMKNVICKRVDTILRENKDPKDSKLIVQPSQKDMQQFARQPAVSALVDGYDFKSRQKRAISEQIVLVDSSAIPPKIYGRPKADYLDRQVVPWSSLSVSSKSNVPTRFGRSPKENKPSSPLDELHFGGHIQTPLLDEVNVGRQKSHASSSWVKEERRPKVVAPSVVHSPPSCVDSKVKGKAPMEINNHKEYYPSPVNPSIGKTVEEMIEYLKESLKKIDEDERREKEEENFKKLIENFNPDENDLLDEEDIFVIHYNIGGSSHSVDPHANELLEVEGVKILKFVLYNNLKQKMDKRLDKMTLS
ncbi:hypothetical protein KFK09_022749 [Dendrobium nobile]|uniref:Uncharacterized protein n=1 Tax=Dendrobium nobile TaxID=94219 RepID=A0A8T3AJN1_DENNO|nr:hypothetical protein KFK09_022749 [Dendrobium nobile]